MNTLKHIVQRRFGSRMYTQRSDSWYHQAHEALNKKVVPRYNLDINGHEWSLTELEARITTIIEKNLNGNSLQIPIIDIIAPETPGAVLSNHAVQCARRMGMICPKINWAPRFVTVQGIKNPKPNVPLTNSEKILKMPERVFSKENLPEYYGQAHNSFYFDVETFWKDRLNLIHSGPSVTIVVLHLMRQHPTVFGEQSVSILHRALQTTTKDRKQISLIDWVPSSIVVARL